MLLEKCRSAIRSSDALQGILWMLYSCFWFSVMGALIRHISTDMNPFQMVFFRNLFSVTCMIPWVLRYGIGPMNTQRWSLYGIRACTGLAGMMLLFYGLSKIPLAQAISLTFTVPLTTTLLAVIWLKEKVDLDQWVAMLLGIVGVLIIVRPDAESFQPVCFVVVAATFFWSISNILVKKLAHLEDPRRIVFIMMIIMVPLSLPLALLHWQTPAWEQLAWLLALGMVTNQAQFALVRAYAKADMGTVLPFDFSRLLFSSVLAYFFFGEVLGVSTLIGALLITACALYVARTRGQRSRRRIALAAKAQALSQP